MNSQNSSIWGRLRLILLSFKTTNSMLTSEKFHLTFYTDIAGWGSTSEGGAKAYQHVPTEIVPPGNVDTVSLLFFVQNFFFDLNIMNIF